MQRQFCGRTLSFTRSYATRYPRPKPGTSEKPPYRAPDPLINNPTAAVTTLPDEELTFIHRPPPTSPSPFSLTTDPASPLLRYRVKPTESALPPLSRPIEKVQPERVSEAVIEKIKKLRRGNPEKYSRETLAKMFGCTQTFVGLVAALKSSKRKSLLKKREAGHQLEREKWSERHTLVKAIRAKRRELW
ncbi:mitochondrial ribosomal protein subunit L20-domain-containing protein [Armillaria luteobubalina]|uniref:Mitochondrial ribosomal protein subunit L20-domain-containing protein n=1 Tax=Armillaria luteobubalina TaxID=153913 RepID=A0AA39QKY1_9AGAR|nr:mitochondrial ribosomal protein subunit L20-domain-containing protein [Armillaria luteobubalina]